MAAMTGMALSIVFVIPKVRKSRSAMQKNAVMHKAFGKIIVFLHVYTYLTRDNHLIATSFMMHKKTLWLTLCLLWLSALAAMGSPRAIYVTTSDLNMRMQPSPNAYKRGVAPRGTELLVVEWGDDWSKVIFEGDTAYAASRYLSYVKDEPVATSKPKKRRSSFSLFTLIGWAFKLALILIVLYIISKVLFYGFAFYYFIMQWIYRITSIPFLITNWLQRWLSKPWRALYKENSGDDRRNEDVDGWLFWAKIPLYILLTPIRLINAIYFNLFAHCTFEMFNYVLEVFVPSSDKEGTDDAIDWALWLPWRIIKYPIWHMSLTVIESLFWTVFDTFVPALTLYHGTDETAALNIVMAPGRCWGGNRMSGIWNVGAGNFAGNGIYFAPVRSTATHYSGGCIIMCRVSLGSVLDLGLAPYRIYRQCGYANAFDVTRYGLKNDYTTGEWWRGDREWWEYCMYDWQNRYNESWRIRPLYVLDLADNTIMRIPGGMGHWLFRKMVIKDLYTWASNL